MSQSLPPRRLMAIVATDVVGFSRLMGVDEAQTLESLTFLQKTIMIPRIQSSGGRVVKLMGDGLLSVFPSAVDAVAAAIEIQELLASSSAPSVGGEKLVVRIGINYAEVVTEGDDVFGDGVNVASRLEQHAPPGGICVSSVVTDALPRNLQLRFDDGGPIRLKNIAKPIHAWYWPYAPQLIRDTRTVIAVLPFRNVAESVDQFLVDGFTEDVGSGLARFRNLSVIATSSAFAFRDRMDDLKEAARSLAANYLVVGDIRQLGEDVRISVRMLEAETEQLIWSERYQRRVADVFDIQNEIVRAIVAQLVSQLENAAYRQSLRKPPSNLAAYECYLRGLVLLRGYETNANERAAEMFEVAIERDESFALAYAYLALARIAVHGYANAPPEILADCATLARKAISLDDGESGCHRMLALSYLFMRDFDNAETEFRRACQLNPSDAIALVQLGGVLARRNRLDEALAWVEQGMRLTPFPPHWYHAVLGNLLYLRSDFEGALRSLRSVPDPGKYTSTRIAAALSMAGRKQEASIAVADILARFPDMTISEFLRKAIVVEKDEQIEKFRLGLLGTGLPD